MTIPVVLSWSGGKDSSLALAALRDSDVFQPVALLTSVTREYDRISIHGVRRALLLQQAVALDLPLFEIGLAPGGSNADYEAAFAAGVAELRRAMPGVSHLAFGDLFLGDVREYRERLVARLGMESLFPLWGSGTRDLAERFVREGYEARLVCVDTTQLDAAFCGRPFDDALLAALPRSVDPCGEHGEFHTFVHAGPIFDAPLGIDLGEIVLRDGRFAYCDLLPAGSLSATES